MAYKALFTSLLHVILFAMASVAAAQAPYSAEQKAACEWLCSHGVEADSASIRLEDDTFEDVLCFHCRRQRATVIVLRKMHWTLVENPVVAYSTNNYITLNNPSIKKYIETLHLQLVARGQGTPMTSIPLPYPPKNKCMTPLLGDLLWGQNFPYNYLAPKIISDSVRTIIGCVPLAIAMVMNYHQWPKRGRSHVYYAPDSRSTYCMDYTKCEPQWELYRSSYAYKDSLEARNLSSLLVSIGLAVDANFSNKGTSAYTNQVKHTMCNNLCYSGKLSLCRDNLTMSNCLALLFRELDSKRPAIVSDNGHAFVCDGYDGDFLHFNFGWSGHCNGYYRLHLSNSTEATSDSALWLKTVLYGIQPEHELRREVTLKKAGTLDNILSQEDKETITELVIRGSINSADIRVLRKMAGAVEKELFSSWWGGSLRHLNLSEATIVNDKEPYFTKTATGRWWHVDGETKRRTDWDFKQMTLQQWRDYKNKLGADHDGWRYSRTDDNRYWQEYYCQKNIVGAKMFADCTSLHEIQLPETTTKVGDYAFENCSSLQRIRLPHKVRELGAKPFRNCLSLEYVAIPSTAETHKDGTAENCSPELIGITRYVNK